MTTTCVFLCGLLESIFIIMKPTCVFVDSVSPFSSLNPTCVFVDSVTHTCVFVLCPQVKSLIFIIMRTTCVFLCGLRDSNLIPLVWFADTTIIVLPAAATFSSCEATAIIMLIILPLYEGSAAQNNSKNKQTNKPKVEEGCFGLLQSGGP